MSITSENNLILAFNDTLVITNITENDLYINIYGSEVSYNFSWTAYYTDSSTVLIETNIRSEIFGGNNEIIVLEFLSDSAFTSIYSGRGVNKETQHTQYLYTNIEARAGKLFGQAALIIFFTSMFVTIISSFGGNSMEMMWNVTNTLQIFYYLSYVYVQFPGNVTFFFSYLQYSNAKNDVISYLSYMVIPENSFTRGSVNDRMEDKAFFVSSSDKMPWLLIFLLLFLLIQIID